MLETRIDLTEQKLRLFSHLGPVKSKTYWDILKKFLVAKLSKREFDIITRDLLDKDDELVALHNKFMLGILRNAYCPQPLGVKRALPPNNKKKKKRLKLTESTEAINQPSLTKPGRVSKRASSSLAASEKPDKQPIAPQAASASLPQEPQDLAEMPRFPRQLRMNSFVRLRKEPSLQAKVNTDAELHMSIAPELASLRRKMMKTALECGVSEISNESVRYMMLSLEYHLKDILEHAKKRGLPIIPTNTAIITTAPTSVSAGSSNTNNIGANKPIAITAPELHTSIEIAPYLFGDHSPLNKEKVSALCDLPPTMYLPHAAPR